MRTVVLVIFVVVLLGATGYLRDRGDAFEPVVSDEAAAAEATPAEAVPGDDVESEPALVAADPSRETRDANDVAESPVARGRSGEPSPSTFYQWVDERGSVHFAASLDEVPPDWRSRAGQVELESAAFIRTASAPVERARPRPVVEVASRSRTHDVTVYTAPWCGWCRKTLAFLDERGVGYDNKDIDSDPGYADELREKTGGNAIPLVEIDGHSIRGFDPQQMSALLD